MEAYEQCRLESSGKAPKASYLWSLWIPSQADVHRLQFGHCSTAVTLRQLFCTWHALPTPEAHAQALGATIITALAVWLCVRILKGRRRWRGLSSNAISRRLGSLGNLNGHKSSMGTPIASLSCITQRLIIDSISRATPLVWALISFLVPLDMAVLVKICV